MSFATEAGRISSKPLAEISRQPQIASTSRLFDCRARHWHIFGSANDRWRFIRDRLRRRDISGLFVQVPRGEDFASSLSALPKLAIDLRVPSAFLFRGYAGANTDYWIDPRKPNEQTIVNLNFCCFGSRTFSPCTLVFQGCVQENGLGISPLNITSVVTGDTGSAVFVLDTNIWKLGLFRGSKKQDLPLRFQRSLVSVVMTAASVISGMRWIHNFKNTKGRVVLRGDLVKND